jgi:flagellar basal body-associated protein FliL
MKILKIISLVLSSFLLLFSLNTALAADDEEGELDNEELYISMSPHFTTNLSDAKGFHLLQLKANVGVIGHATRKLVKLHMPAIRHELIMHFTSLKVASLKGSKNRAALAKKAKEIIQAGIAKYDAEAKVDSFLIQSIVVE